MTAPNFREIETASFARVNVPPTFGRSPRLDWIPIRALVIDPDYQREISGRGRNNVRRIAESFNWSMFAPVIVAAVGGNRYAIVDGQHRTTAAALIGIEKVPCMVTEAPRGEQAEAFRAINVNTTRLHTVHIFHAAVAAGDPPALAAMKVCTAAGVKIPKSMKPCKDFETHSIGSIMKGIARHGEAIVTLALRAIVHSGEGRSEELNHTIIVGVIETLAASPAWCRDERRLLLAFEDFDLESMWREAAATAARVKGISTRERLQSVLTKRLSVAFGSAPKLTGAAP